MCAPSRTVQEALFRKGRRKRAKEWISLWPRLMNVEGMRTLVERVVSGWSCELSTQQNRLIDPRALR